MLGLVVLVSASVSGLGLGGVYSLYLDMYWIWWLGWIGMGWDGRWFSSRVVMRIGSLGEDLDLHQSSMTSRHCWFVSCHIDEFSGQATQGAADYR